jgi:hypothetical protein
MPFTTRELRLRRSRLFIQPPLTRASPDNGDNDYKKGDHSEGHKVGPNGVRVVFRSAGHGCGGL